MHTKGPWEVFEGPEDRPELTVVYEDKTGQLVMVADCLSSDVPPKERKENAHLIASAPDLLMIVKHLKELFDSGADKVYRDSIAIGDDDRTLQNYVDAAIAKAEGRDGK